MKEKRTKNLFVVAIVIIVTTCFIEYSYALFSETSESKPIVDSKMTFEEAIAGTQAPQELIDKLVLLDVEYYSTDKRLHAGQIVVHKDVAEDVKTIFQLIKETRFPVAKAVPIVKYAWSDDASMNNNNCSAFNYRFVAGTERLSNHAFGKAVDINPRFNPVIYESGKISPKGAAYDPKREGTFHKDCPIYKKFIELGWRWGGDFISFKDYHHFDKK